MKMYIHPLLFFLLCSIRVMQNDFLVPNEAYAVTKMEGKKTDLDNLFFLQSVHKNSRSKVIVKYDDILNRITIMSDTSLVAYYNVERSDSGMYINNYSPLREKLSYNDLRERRYKLGIKEDKSKKKVLIISNHSEMNSLKSSIYLTLEMSKNK